MSKKAAITFVCIYLFLYILNCLHPMSFGDDYLYSFIWQGKPMSEPLSKDAVRVSSLHDIIVSQWSHYFTWGGRTVAHVLAQFFLLMGKNVFNYFNALIAVVLVAEIYWCTHKGNVSLDFKAETICWISFVLWAFTPGFSPVFFWLTAACNYLWTNVILLAFLIPYIRKYYSSLGKIEESIFFAFLMFVFGIVAGWTNENSVCWIILVLFVFIYKKGNFKETEKWLYAGLTGLITGYAFLVFAPGNSARFLVEQAGGSNWLNFEAIKSNLKMFFVIVFFQLFLWFFSLRAMNSLTKMNINIKNKMINKDILLVKIFCMLALGMSGIMLLSPGFPPRSGFSGTIQIIIAAGILLRMQEEYEIVLIQRSAKKFLFFVASLYFVLTASVTIYKFYKTDLYFQTLLTDVKHAQVHYKNKTLIVRPMEETSYGTDMMSGFHLPGFKLSGNENDWENVAFSRYYGIKGVRMVKEETEEGDDIKETIKPESTLTGSQSR